MSWISAGLTSEVLLHSWLLVPCATAGGRRRRKAAQHLKCPFHVLPTTSCTVAHGQSSWGFPLFSPPEVSQKPLFVGPPPTVNCALGTTTTAAPHHPSACTGAPGHGAGGPRVWEEPVVCFMPTEENELKLLITAEKPAFQLGHLAACSRLGQTPSKAKL